MAAALGIDAAAGGWLGILLLDGAYAGAALAPRLVELLAAFPAAAAVGVDIPIGLPEDSLRPADAAAREFVGPARAASVFFAPPRAVLEAEPYEAAVEEARRRTGLGVSRQAYGLRHRILEVADLAVGDGRIIEVHPEVSFAALNGGPLPDSKHSWRGIAHRRALLTRAGIVVPDGVPGGNRAAPDDVVDAAAAAWSALRVAEGRSRTLPRVPSGDRAVGGVIRY